jgi:hypothetical protein
LLNAEANAPCDDALQNSWGLWGRSCPRKMIRCLWFGPSKMHSLFLLFLCSKPHPAPLIAYPGAHGSWNALSLFSSRPCSRKSNEFSHMDEPFKLSFVPVEEHEFYFCKTIEASHTNCICPQSGHKVVLPRHYINLPQSFINYLFYLRHHWGHRYEKDYPGFKVLGLTEEVDI